MINPTPGDGSGVSPLDTFIMLVLRPAPRAQ